MSNCVFSLSLFYLQCQKPGPYVKEMNDAAMFYTNRVLKDYKDTLVVFFMYTRLHRSDLLLIHLMVSKYFDVYCVLVNDNCI